MIELWLEGYTATCEDVSAHYYGKFKGATLKEVVMNFKYSLTDLHSISCIDIEELTFWGCKFYDNEKDARRRNG